MRHSPQKLDEINLTFAIICLLFLFLACSCAPKSQDFTDHTQTITLNQASCEELSIDKNYVIQTSKEFYSLRFSQLYSVDNQSEETNLVQDGVLNIDNVCKFTIEAGSIIKIEAVYSSCGGDLQPKCKEMVPQPYICGPNWKICFK